MPRTFPQPGNGEGPVEYDYDLFVIGGGSGGVRASRTAADFGAKVRIHKNWILLAELQCLCRNSTKITDKQRVFYLRFLLP